MEKYLYFTNPNDTGAPDAGAELAMYPASAVRAIFAASATTTTIMFVPRDGAAAGDDHDTVVLTHADGDHKNVMAELVSLMKGEKNKSPFVVVSDKAKGVFNITGVTACAITTAD